MTHPTAPVSTYRLQFNRSFTFRHALQIIPYLHRLGISHVYASPVLKARAGSAHGYDIVDHGSLNPELGNDDEFLALTAALKHHGMGMILDIVPNHMGVWSDDNPWWLDIMEHGEASQYAAYFDIDWHPADPALKNKVLVPCLAEHYGTALESGKLQLGLDPLTGAFAVHYYQHLFPIDPRTYPKILAPVATALARTDGIDRQDLDGFHALLHCCRTLPRRTELAAPSRRRRQQGVITCKASLAQLYGRSPIIARMLDTELRRCNGTPDNPASLDRLHNLLDAQAYRLAHWLVATDEINYRRFFDINDLAGIRMDHQAVFTAAHRRIAQMLSHSHIDGLRIDHPDGLSDPYKYLLDLQMLARRVLSATDPTGTSAYVVVEKILAADEPLPESWPVSGTTGYEAAHLINGLFVYPHSARQLERTYAQFIGGRLDFQELLYTRKKLVMRTTLAGELTVLANIATGIARADRHNRDFTYLGLRDALAEIVASFPVYRTYFTRQRTSEKDLQYLRHAIFTAKQHSRPKDILIFDYLHELLSLRALAHYSARIRRQITQLVLRFQQYTAPVMAKALEDTTLYVYNRLLSLNDVGFNPRQFGISRESFHAANQRRLTRWPHSMIGTSTHDSKRSEDVRARLNVLSELPEQWRRHAAHWRVLNRRKKHRADHHPKPSANDEYLLYQTLIGTWPLEHPGGVDLSSYRERIERYMIKAVNEARVHSSWINRNAIYEQAVTHFINELFLDPAHNRFLDDFIPFQKRIAQFGMYNSLSQTLLKLTIPGIPDIYQGNDLWTFRMADPDNRQPVDYTARDNLLRVTEDAVRTGPDRRPLLDELCRNLSDGRLKQYVIWCALTLRQTHPNIFMEGDYRELTTDGMNAEHICAFTRSHASDRIIVSVSRWLATLTGGLTEKLGTAEIWRDTWVECPSSDPPHVYRNVLDGTVVSTTPRESKLWFSAEALFERLPVALLTTE